MSMYFNNYLQSVSFQSAKFQSVIFQSVIFQSCIFPSPANLAIPHVIQIRRLIFVAIFLRFRIIHCSQPILPIVQSGLRVIDGFDTLQQPQVVVRLYTPSLLSVFFAPSHYEYFRILKSHNIHEYLRILKPEVMNYRFMVHNGWYNG